MVISYALISGLRPLVLCNEFIRRYTVFFPKASVEIGAYEVVNEGDLIINGFKTEPTLEGNKLTLYQFMPKEDGAFKKVDGKYVKIDADGKESPAVGIDTTMVLVRK